MLSLSGGMLTPAVARPEPHTSRSVALRGYKQSWCRGMEMALPRVTVGIERDVPLEGVLPRAVQCDPSRRCGTVNQH